MANDQRLCFWNGDCHTGNGKSSCKCMDTLSVTLPDRFTVIVILGNPDKTQRSGFSGERGVTAS